MVEYSIFPANNPQIFFDGWLYGWLEVKTALVWPLKKPLFFIEKMLRLLEIFLVKNSSPFFSKLVRVRGPNHYILLIGTIKPYNICYWHFLLRSFLSEIFNDPFHQTKKGETNKTIIIQQWKPLHNFPNNNKCHLRVLWLEYPHFWWMSVIQFRMNRMPMNKLSLFKWLQNTLVVRWVGIGGGLWSSSGKRWCALKETAIVLLIHLLQAPK